MASEQLSLKRRLITVAINYADLGFTSFGGPPVHFGILYDRFVKKLGWIDDKTYQELFAVSQALPGPASTKLAFAIALNYAGFLPSLLAFALWSLPGAIGMYGLALGIARVKETLPDPVYGLITGLNAATVGLIAQAGVQLSSKAITDGLSRSILIISACAGLCYTALWYFPVLMTAAGIAAVIYDLYLRRALFRFRMALRRTYLKLQKRQATSGQDVQRESVHEMTDQASHDSNSASQATEAEGARPPFTIRLVPGLTVIGLFFALFVTLMGLRAHFSKLVELRLFTNMVLAGTIIFGGGPVVIPLLREYIVQEGWVSSRDFLLGLAIIQSFPGPNFNFSVYLGALASASTSTPSWVTALLAYIGIFLPGLMLTTGMSSIWARIPRQYRPFVSSLLRGINAAAVGLIWTAVYRLWNAGNLTHSSVAANSLGSEPWWLVVATAAFAGHQWYSVPAPLCIVLGGCMGLGWWAVN